MYKMCLRYVHYIRFQAQINMPESLNKKKRRLYDHLNRAMENPVKHKILHDIIIRNATGREICQSPNEDIFEIYERLKALEFQTRRIALLEMQLEITINALAKVIRLYC